MAAVDLDRDGDVDLVHSATNDGVRVYEDRLGGDGAWLGLTLERWSPGTDAVAAWLEAGDRRLTPVRLVQRGGWFQAHLGNEVHFGLPDDVRETVLDGQAILVVSEIGRGSTRCLTLDEVDRWVAVDVQALAPC